MPITKSYKCAVRPIGTEKCNYHFIEMNKEQPKMTFILYFGQNSDVTLSCERRYLQILKKEKTKLYCRFLLGGRGF